VDPSAAPWRILEEAASPADPVPATADREPGGRAGHPSFPRSSLLIGGSAAGLAIIAFVLAFGSGSAGSVDIDGGVAYVSGRPAASASADPLGVANTSRILVVEVVGAVDRPGVYRLAAGSRVGDVVAAAGGYGPRVDADRAGRELNLAALLHDGDQIRVPSRDDASTSARAPGAGGPDPSGGGAATTPIDLNRATAAELDTLPGIGPATAAKIIASREKQAFVTVADLQTRKLVGPKTFEKLKDLVAVP
jgi:competence protein ComEA